MATIHPSRMAMVPQTRAPRRSPTPTPPPAPPLSREEELRLKLLAKRKNQHPESSAGGLRIKGSSKLDKDDELLADIYRDDRLGDASRESGPSRAIRSRGGSPLLSRRTARDERERGDCGHRSQSRSRNDERYPPPQRSRSRSRSLPRRDDRYPPRSRYDERYPPRHDERDEPRQRSGSRDRRPPPQDDRYEPGYRSRSRDRRPPTHRDARDDFRQPPPHLPPFPPKWDQALPQVAPPIRIGFGGPDPAGLAGPVAGQGQNQGYQSGPGPRGQGGNGFRYGGPVDFERRRLERENNPLSIWPASPKSPYRDEDDPLLKSKKKSKKSKSKRHRRYSDESDSTDSEEEERRRRRRREKRKKDVSDDEGKGKTRSRRGGSEVNSEDEKDRIRRDKSRSKSKSALSPAPGKKDDWIEKEKTGVASTSVIPDAQSESDDGDMVGPSLPAEHREKARRQAFKDMMPGEAAAMALYAAKGERIPRRGEVGLDSSRIEEFETSGYVMSGNRNKKMNAVRLRKENQVISAEEKRAILNLQKEERMKKEGAIISQFKELLDDNWRSQGLKGKPGD